MTHRILVIDDEKNIRDLIKYNLEQEGFEVLVAEDGEKGLDQLTSEVDLIILDLMLPGIDGLEVCRKIKKNDLLAQIPIIMLTARGEEVDKVVGLEIGADDYMVKPFSPRELLARIRAVLRRIDIPPKNTSAEKNRLTGGDLTINLKSHEVKVGGEKINLTPKEFDLLRLLVANKNNVFSRESLLEKVWDYSYGGTTRTVDVHIRRLRSKIGEQKIETVRGVGYKFVVVE